MAGPIRIAALISGTGSNMEAILKACEAGRINGRVVTAGSDRPSAAGLSRAEKRNIPTFVVDYGKIIREYRADPDPARLPADFDPEEIAARQALYKNSDRQRLEFFLATRAIAEAALLRELENSDFDLLVLAGFMRNLTPYFIDRVNKEPGRPRIMNIHPALLPAFAGTDGYGDTFRHGCKVGGCTVHFIDYGEDSGPIIGQRCFDIEDGDTIASVKEKGLAAEWELYPECIRLFAENRLETVKMTHTLSNGKLYQRTIVRVIH